MFTYILFIVFCTAFAAETAVQIFEADKKETLSFIADEKEDAKEKEGEKEKTTEFEKDKLTPVTYSLQFDLLTTSKFYLATTNLLPQPLAEVEIIPPELVG